MSIEERIAKVLEQHRPKRIKRGLLGGDYEQCIAGCKYEPGTCYRHFASVLVAELGLTDQWCARHESGGGAIYDGYADARKFLDEFG